MSKLFGNYTVLCIFEWGSVHYNQMPNPSETNHSKRILATPVSCSVLNWGGGVGVTKNSTRILPRCFPMSTLNPTPYMVISLSFFIFFFRFLAIPES